MSSREYDEILTSLQDVVRRAYALGKSDALKQVIEVMQTDDSIRKPLALTGPSDPPHAPAVILPPVPDTPAPAVSGEPVAPVAWWARPARTAAVSRGE